MKAVLEKRKHYNVSVETIKHCFLCFLLIMVLECSISLSYCVSLCRDLAIPFTIPPLPEVWSGAGSLQWKYFDLILYDLILYDTIWFCSDHTS